MRTANGKTLAIGRTAAWLRPRLGFLVCAGEWQAGECSGFMTSADIQNCEPPALPESLTFAIQAIATDAGYEIGRDDLNAALGLSFYVTAVPREGDLGCWPMYARDAFLVEAGRLFGFTIRDMHPPEAARGLRGVPEFRQHFDASYRPLVQRALENGQRVLAWQGWPGDRELMWGLITASCDSGIGLRGATYGSADSPLTPEAAVLTKPPVQLYVVESVQPTNPEPQRLLRLALENAGKILSNELAERFDVLMGPSAYDLWIERLRNSPTAESAMPDALESHRRLATAVIAGHQSAIRFLEARITAATSQRRASVKRLTSLCRSIVGSLEQSLRAAVPPTVGGSPRVPATILDSLARAHDTTEEMLTA